MHIYKEIITKSSAGGVGGWGRWGGVRLRRPAAMLLDEAQQAEYAETGFIVLREAFAELAPLTKRFVAAYHQLREESHIEDEKGNKYRLRAQTPGSYWTHLDHSLPALQIILHDEVVELGRQLLGESDV